MGVLWVIIRADSRPANTGDEFRPKIDDGIESIMEQSSQTTITILWVKTDQYHDHREDAELFMAYPVVFC